MTALEQLNEYLRRLELRLRLIAVSRGVAIVTALALLLTVLLVSIANRYAFAQSIVLPFRILLFLAIAAVIAIALAVPLLRLNRRAVTGLAERQVPGLEQRLLTVTERQDKKNPFTELLAEETLRIARENRTEEIAPSKSFLAFVASAVAAFAILLWLIVAAPGYWGYGASLLWTGQANPGRRPLYDIAVQPGNRTVRRKSDQTITAQLYNFSARRVSLHARYGNASKWEEAAMQPQRDGSGYQFLFAGISDPVEYYVQADAAQSKHFTLGVKDLPVVKRLRVEIHFPSGLGLKDEVDDPGGDIRAVVQSTAKIGVITDKKLENGALILENGSKIPLIQGSATLQVTKNGSYHVAAIENGEAIRISEDFFIDGKNDEPPSVKILRPGNDPKVSPIEEMPVTIEAADDFGLNSMELHYSVNGGADQVIAFPAKSQKSASGTAMLSLENFKLVPGDIVSMYASAKDANTTSQSDIIFAQAEPFDYTFRQAQQNGGGGGMGGGDQADRISDRQKEIIAATWNQLRSGSKDKNAAADNAKFLAGTEGKLGEQAKSLADRMGSREMIGSNPEFEAFSKIMNQAFSDMNSAVDELKPEKWHDALAPEQKALQSLLRAEAIFRDIQVAFGQSGAGAGGSGAQRDLARMFDLELDTTKNQYESGQSQQSSASQQQKAIDEALQRLKDLAKRQQELASQPQQQAQAMQQRWEEEQLRREAEELRQQMQQRQQAAQQQQQNQSGQSSASPSGKGQAAQAQAQAQAMKDAMQSLQKAEDEMRNAVSNRDSTAQQRAAEQLAQAENALRNSLHQQAGNSVNEMSQQAQQLAEAQRNLADRIKGMYGTRGDPRSESNENGGAMPQMPDPERSQFGYGWRRRAMPDPGPQRPATQREKDAAAEKDKLAEQLQQLEKQMGDQARAMGAEQPDAASKVRKALSDAQQEELALRMQKNAQWIRQGYGDRTSGMEDSVTAGMEQLSRQLREAQAEVKAGNDSQNQDAKTAQALAQVRALREQFESQAQQSGGRASGEDVRNTMQQLSELRASQGSNDRQLNAYIDSAMGALRNYANGQQSILQGRINQDTVASLERLEIELGKRIGEQKADGTRIGANENAPEQYRDAVAEYFRKLSK